MTLLAIVEKYRQLTPGFGTALPLADFGLTRDETERTFGIFDEDYHISRFFHFTLDPALPRKAPTRSTASRNPTLRSTRKSKPFSDECCGILTPRQPARGECPPPFPIGPITGWRKRMDGEGVGFSDYVQIKPCPCWSAARWFQSSVLKALRCGSRLQP